MISLRRVQDADLEQLLFIENESFTSEEAATEEAFMERIKLIADTFIVAVKDGKILGYINGPVIAQPYITDDLFKKITANPAHGGYQSILGLAVSTQARGQGIARILIEAMEELVVQNEREGITLTCTEELIPFYEKSGFVNHGLSESQHGGLSWYNLIKLRENMNGLSLGAGCPDQP
ncbi:GNAT family N-acetyltransferase [Paenibacillus sp. YPG26]|uniref:GNAT family N-acetyltransferase n=1 Tax=Paenibacillus sp. YPG26 TaxID=2878915 RepID=UPI00203F06F2|nr:GNAT family N-acetyltransferase [Paenibacillus sp. YPG26]USB32303.1 GNAT family N-acetyltransferase [Paenibacillus sp. YPG26]